MMKKIITLFLLATVFIYCQPVRGVWLTNVDSKVLYSKKNIIEAVKFCKETGINTIFMVVWNKGYTLYPSKIMKNMIGEEIIPDFKGRDPLKEMISEAHKKKIKVIAWFEFGFSSSFQLNGGKLLQVKPEWASKNNNDSLVTKNGFDWMNGFKPEVQDFMSSLILEVVKNYKVDGIQGDDRLPAMPVEAGYDDYTVNLYNKEFHTQPPVNFRDSAFIQWRADILTVFMQRIYNEVKAVNKNIIVSMAPSLYPWAKEEYLQDWPKWLKNKNVDMICPQLYRYDIKDYILALDEIVKTQLNKDDAKKFFPGILLKVGKYIAPKDYIKRAIDENRKRGVDGEVFFFYEGLKNIKDVLKEEYKTR